MGETNKHINYTAADIEKYWQKKLPVADMHAMEKAALDDPFLADAMEGYQNRHLALTNNNAANTAHTDISELTTRLTQRIKEKKAIPLLQQNWWKVAAALIIGFAGFCSYLYFKKNTLDTTIAKNEKQHIASDIVITPNADSSITFIAPSDTLANTITTNKEKAIVKNSTQTDTKKTINNEVVSIEKEPITAASEENAIPTNSIAKNNDKADIIINPETKAKEIATQNAPAAISKAEKNFEDDGKRKQTIVENTNNNISTNTFKGTVLDEQQQPVANAAIQIPSLKIATTTNDKGYFSFTSADTALNVSIASTGFQTQQLKLQNGNIAANKIILKQQDNLDDEKGIINEYSGIKKRTVRKTKDITLQILDAAPVIDWNTYNDYLEKNKKTPDELKHIHGDVVISFMVDKDGLLKNFTIVKSLQQTLDEEAIRLIKEGPLWKVLKGKKAKASVIVKF